MKNNIKITLISSALVFSGVASAGWTDLLDQANEAVNGTSAKATDTADKSTAAVKDASATANDVVTKTTEAVEKVSTAPDAVTEKAESSTAEKAGLVDSLVKELGVSPAQAEGGSGAIFQAAKNNMSADEFSELSKSIPGMDGILAAAPKEVASTSSTSDLLGGLAKATGNSSLTDAAGLINSFKELGLSSDMVTKFSPVVLDYVKQAGGETSATLLKAALGL